MKKTVFLLTTVLSLSSAAVAQDAIVNQEIELATLLDSLRAAKDDAAKAHWNAQFKKQMEFSLNEPTAFTYPFSKLRTVGKIDSPDHLVRIICWNVEQDDESQKYYAYVLKLDERKGTHKIIELVDNSMMLPPRTDEVLDEKNWYGALYYAIIPVEKGSKTYYTLLGWDGNNAISNIKLIDVMYFSGNGLKLGSPMFKSGDQLTKRVYMEHAEKCVMTLNWDESQQRIMFDHLSPETPTMEGFYEGYVPDMSLDAYEFTNNKWLLVEDVIGVNPDRENITIASYDPRTGELVERESEYKWVDPTTEGSPASKEVHIAMTPDKTDGSGDKTTRPKKPKTEPTNAMEEYEKKKGRGKEKQHSISFSNEKGSKKKKRR